MGEAAEDILDGSCCQVCGVWFVDVLIEKKKPPGFPRTCLYCGDTIEED